MAERRETMGNNEGREKRVGDRWMDEEREETERTVEGQRMAREAVRERMTRTSDQQPFEEAFVCKSGPRVFLHSDACRKVLSSNMKLEYHTWMHTEHDILEDVIIHPCDEEGCCWSGLSEKSLERHKRISHPITESTETAAKKTKTVWTNEVLNQLIEEYRSRPILWNQAQPDFGDFTQCCELQHEIAADLSRKFATTISDDDVRTQWYVLKTKWVQHMLAVNRWTCTGTAVREAMPNFEYAERMSFLVYQTDSASSSLSYKFV
ncbi:unnamed protein product [Toxocara canis]|uniref:MADF domain-containing protein n=1 Tax=Toxocara canis TaxID=6265 RepID=A0A183VF34_TOXCA|nr:unnamed protein product [Toxocara canis]